MEICPLRCILDLESVDAQAEVQAGSGDLFGLADVGGGGGEHKSGHLGCELNVAIRVAGVVPVRFVE